MKTEKEKKKNRKRERHQKDEKILSQKNLGKAGLNKSCAERYGASFSAAKGIQFVL